MAQFERLKPAVVLVVEDEFLIQLELKDWLTELGLIVLAADNADEAIDLLNAHPDIECMLTDIQMPGSMDGLRLSHHVARLWPPIRIIVISGLFGTPLSDLPPGSVFIPKPFNHGRLHQALSPDGVCA